MSGKTRRPGDLADKPVDDAVELVTPDGEAVGGSGRDVAEQVNLLPEVLRLLQLPHEPLELSTGVLRVQQQQPVCAGRRLNTPASFRLGLPIPVTAR